MRPIAACAAALILTTSLAAQAAQRYTVSGPDVAIYNLAGTLRADAAGGNDVVVEVTRGGSDAAKLQVATGAIGSRQTLRVVYPDDDVVYPAGSDYSTSLDVRDDGTFGDEHAERDGRRVRIRGSGRGTEAWADLHIGIPKGQRIAVYLAVGRVTVSNVDGHVVFDVSSADVDVTGLRGALGVNAGSGDVRVTGVTGDLDLDTGSGDVTVTDASGGLLRIDTGSGDVTVTGADVTGLSIDTGSGQADATAVKTANVKIDTGSGDVSLALLTPVADIDIDTGSGEVELTLPVSFAADVVLDTGSGDIDLGGFALTVHRLQSDHVEGRIGAGQGRLRVETGSGDVQLKQS